MAFAAVGTNIIAVTNPRCRHEHAGPTLVYDTKTGALSVGPKIPDRIHDFGAAAMAAGERLYALTSVDFILDESPSLHVLSWAPSTKPEQDTWDPDMEWSWGNVTPPSSLNGYNIVAHALHPDGRTIFMSTSYGQTHSFDTTSNGAWKEIGDWVLPFQGRAHFDAELDAWVGLHHEENGHVCCCPVVSRSSAKVTSRPPECKMLREKMFHREEEEVRARSKAILTYMGDSTFCLVENFMPRGGVKDAVPVLHVTIFGLKYDTRGDLQTKIRRTSRSCAVPKSSIYFADAAFWI